MFAELAIIMNIIIINIADANEARQNDEANDIIMAKKKK